MRVLIVEPGKAPRVEEIENTLGSLQETVGGLIEMADPPIHPDDAVIICNEEGKYNGSEPNRPIRMQDGTPYDIIMGPFIICRAPCDSDDFDSLTDEQIKYYSRLYAC